LSLQKEEERYLPGEDHLSLRIITPYGGFCQTDQLFWGDSHSPSPFRQKHLCNLLLRERSYLFSRWVELEEIEHPSTIDVALRMKLWESDRYELFNLVFDPHYLKDHLLPLSCDLFDLRMGERRERDGIVEGGDEGGDGESVFLVGLALSEREFGEVGNKERVNQSSFVSHILQVREDTDVVAGGGFSCNEDRFLVEGAERVSQSLYPFHLHRSGEEEDLVLVLVNGTSCERFFGDVDSNEDLRHHNTPKTKVARAGAACRPFLHHDKGSLAQPTYYGFGRQGTDSFKGFKAQVIRVLLPCLLNLYHNSW